MSLEEDQRVANRWADRVGQRQEKVRELRGELAALRQKCEAMSAYIAGEPIEVARPGYDDPLIWRPWIANTSTSKPLFDGPCLFRRAANNESRQSKSEVK